MCLAGLNAKGCQPLRVNPRSLYLTPPSLPTPVSLASSGSLGRLHYLFAGSSFERGWLRTPDRDTHPLPSPFASLIGQSASDLNALFLQIN